MTTESTIKGQRYRCRHCKSEDVRATLPLWINPNTGEHHDTDEGAEFGYGLCNACEETGGFLDVCEEVPEPVRGYWRELPLSPAYRHASRDEVSRATGRALAFVEACENSVIHGDDESALCGKAGGPWFEFVREVRP